MEANAVDYRSSLPLGYLCDNVEQHSSNLSHLEVRKRGYLSMNYNLLLVKCCCCCSQVPALQACPARGPGKPEKVSGEKSQVLSGGSHWAGSMRTASPEGEDRAEHHLLLSRSFMCDLAYWYVSSCRAGILTISGSPDMVPAQNGTQQILSEWMKRHENIYPLTLISF